ncbi:hypothetical protein OsJ_21276 [Oryza sativa Japonica Group]|uniref:Uncharacterized protein n=2 Tax=Oryza sativa subsp. japonica TaxID=39947 RepID=A3BBK0_ORYSJ|nr:hypothetical protein OsJ_21276 [Oryza sativa Japonica Group]
MKALVAAAAALLAHLLTAAGHRRSYHCHQLAQPSHRAWSGARPALSPPTKGFPAAASYVPPLRRVTTSSGSMRLLLPFTITDTPTLLLRRSRLHQALRRGSPSSFKASKLGIKELLPAYKDQDLELNDLLTGVAFASGGSGYDPLTSISTAISSSGQLNLFSDYKQKLTSLIGEEAMTRILSEAVFFTVMGANDLLNNYFTLPVRRHQYDIPGYVDFVVSNAVNFTLTMNEMGAKMIGFVGVPPLGCCPSQRTGPSRECEPLRNQASELFNTRMKQEIDRLNVEHNIDGLRVVYFDIYYNLLDLIHNPGYYGFKDTSDGCCGNTVLNAAIFIKYHSACPNVYDYIFWDSFHPTEKAYDIVVDKLIQENKQYLM